MLPRRSTKIAAPALAAFLVSTFLTAAPAQAQATPDTLISVCSGVSLPASVVTELLRPVLTGIYGPIEGRVNGVLSVLTNPIFGSLVLPGQLNVQVNDLLATAANPNNDVGLSVLALDGTLVGPSDPCNAQADSFTLSKPAGIAIGGNAVTGLGSPSDEAQAGEINSIALGNRAQTDAAATGSIALGTDASVGAGGAASVALGTGSEANVSNSVALGAGSIANRGPQTNYVAFGLAGTQNSAGEVSVGSPGQERQITNVAAGSAPTDAANLAQLQAVADLVPDNAVQYNDGTNTTLTLAGAGGTLINNVTAGAVTATSTDVVNGSQLFDVMQQVQVNTTAITNLQSDITNIQTDVTGLQTTITNIANGNSGPVRYSDAATPTTPNGGVPSNDLTLVGAAPGAVGLHNVAAGAVNAGSTDAVNGGQLFLTNVAVTAAQQTANQALQLNQNAVTYDSSTRTSVTLGNASSPVALRNIAAGTAGTDAVNVSQLRSVADNAVSTANRYTDARFEALNFDLGASRREAKAGTSAALAAAALPQAMDAGKNMIAAGVGSYRGRAAMALGASHRTDSGQAVFRVGVTYDSSDHIGANGGVGFQF